MSRRVVGAARGMRYAAISLILASRCRLSLSIGAYSRTVLWLAMPLVITANKPVELRRESIRARRMRALSLKYRDFC